MNKSKSVFRKCGYCPHHKEQPKCCCNKPMKSSQKLKKNKSKQNPFINESSIRYVDQNQGKFQQINLSNLIAQNSMLKYENNHLKNDLMSLSHCINEDKNAYNKQYSTVTASTTLKTESQQVLSDRLYISNKNLQQAILQVDSLSRRNKELSDKNALLNSEIGGYCMENEELKQDIAVLKKQLRKYQQTTNDTEKNTLKENFKTLRQKYENLKIQNSNLNEEIQRLKLQLSKRNSVSPDNMSPEWIASTSNKLSYIEQKIDCAQNRFKSQEPQRFIKSQIHTYDQIQTPSNTSYFQMLHQIKNEIALSINTIHSKTRKFNPIFDTVGNVENMNAKNLICTLIEGFVQCCISLNIAIEREVNRRINVLEKRMENLLGKLENFVLQFKNRQLRKRSRSCSRVLIKNKSGLSSKSHCINIPNKENFNSINSMDKNY